MILDTFEILFSTSAKKAREEVIALDKELGELEKKGKKRSDEENKRYQELQKQRKEQLDEIKQQRLETDKLSNSFQNMAANAIGAVTAFATFHGLKNTLIDVNKLNASLAIAHDSWGVNVQDLKTVAAALDKAGGNGQQFMQWYLAFTQQNVSQGLGAVQPRELIKRATEAFNTSQGQRLLTANGLLPVATELLNKSPQEQAALLASGFQNAGKSFTPEAQKAALANQGAAATTQQVEQTRATEILTKFSGAVVDFNKGVQKFLDVFADHPVAAAAASVGGIGLKSYGAWKLFKWLTGRGAKAVPSLDAETEAAGAGLGTFLAAIGTAAITALWPSTANPGNDDQLIAEAIKKRTGRLPLGIRYNNPGNLRPGGHEAIYSSPQVGISALGNQLRRYGGRGWNTISSILSHYAPPLENNTGAYIAAVSRETGFSPNQVLDLNDTATLDKLTSAIIRHENGFNPYSSSLIQSSILAANHSLASASSGGIGKSVSVKTGDISINTQATDAQGIANTVASELKNQIRLAMNNLDDGVNY